MFSFDSDEYFNRTEGWYLDDIAIVKRTGWAGGENSTSESIQNWSMQHRLQIPDQPATQPENQAR